MAPMGEVGPEPSLAGELLARAVLDVASSAALIGRQDHLDGHGPVQARVPPQVDLPHSSAAQLLLEHVTSVEHATRRKDGLQPLMIFPTQALDSAPGPDRDKGERDIIIGRAPGPLRSVRWEGNGLARGTI